jgi:hypothetical protein
MGYRIMAPVTCTHVVHTFPLYNLLLHSLSFPIPVFHNLQVSWLACFLYHTILIMLPVLNGTFRILGILLLSAVDNTRWWLNPTHCREKSFLSNGKASSAAGSLLCHWTESSPPSDRANGGGKGEIVIPLSISSVSTLGLNFHSIGAS